MGIEIIHRNITVKGHVQGVGFRFAARNAAQRFKILGFVKNKINGAVYIEVEGKIENIASFIKWCSEGPPNARVHDVEILDGDVVNFHFFEIYS